MAMVDRIRNTKARKESIAYCESTAGLSFDYELQNVWDESYMTLCLVCKLNHFRIRGPIACHIAPMLLLDFSEVGVRNAEHRLPFFI